MKIKIFVWIVIIMFALSSCNNGIESPCVSESMSKNTIDKGTSLLSSLSSEAVQSNAIKTSLQHYTDNFDEESAKQVLEDALHVARSVEDENSTDRDFLNLIDNDTELVELLKKNKSKVSESITWLLANRRVNEAVIKYNESSELCYKIEAIEYLLGQEISFVRSIGEFYNELENMKFYALYTVFESELNGYIYIWFDYYPEDGTVFLKEITYLDKKLSSNDFVDIENLFDVAEITDSIKPLTYNIEAYGSYQFCSKTLLIDGVLVVNYSKEYPYKIINKTLYNFSIPHYPPQYDSAWINRNWTILPQDYPPAG